jgi:HK97 gp10 family phage protein
MVARLEVKGIDEARQSMENIAEALAGREMMQAMGEANNLLIGDAKRFAPVDTGRLRSSITGQVSQVGFPMPRVQGIVGTNVEYSAYMEFGTGIFAGNAPVRMPPARALEGWARRHGLNAAVVARAIYLRGGLKARHYFLRSLQKNEARVIELIGNKVKLIIERS